MRVRKLAVKDLSAAMGYRTDVYRPNLSVGLVVWGFTCDHEGVRRAIVRHRSSKHVATSEDSVMYDADDRAELSDVG